MKFDKPFKEKKQRDVSKQSQRSVLTSYFNEDELKDFGKNDPVIYEGELYRFKPGIEHNFISRWI